MTANLIFSHLLNTILKFTKDMRFKKDSPYF